MVLMLLGTLWPPTLGLIVQERALRFFVGHHLLSVYLTSTHVTNLPGLSPPYLHTISDQILEVGRPGNEATVALLTQPMQG